MPEAQTSRNCFLKEANDGVIINAKSGNPFTLEDPCMEKGAQVAYNAAAHQATVKAVKEFLTERFKLE